MRLFDHSDTKKSYGHVSGTMSNDEIAGLNSLAQSHNRVFWRPAFRLKIQIGSPRLLKALTARVLT